MAVQERMHGKQQVEIKTFEWKMQLWDYTGSLNTTMQISPYFQFYGYYCQLHCKPMQHEKNNLYMVVILKGYAAPFQEGRQIKCSYTLRAIDNAGNECFTKRNTIETSEETIHAVIYDDYSDYLILDSSIYLFFLFCWYETVQDTVSDQEKESCKLLEILSKDLGSFYEGKMDTDCVLKVGETKFPAHRSLLSARSTVFAAMFHHDTSESRNGEVDILDVDDDVFGDVLYYIYSGKIRGLSPDTAASMYIAADKYALIEFREKCMEFLMLNLNVNNVCDAALIAHAHAETKLENEIIQFIEVNLEEIMLNDTWIRFSDTHYKIANKLLSSAFIASKKKMQIIHSD